MEVGLLWIIDEAAGVLRVARTWVAQIGDVRGFAGFAAASLGMSLHSGEGLPGRVMGAVVPRGSSRLRSIPIFRADRQPRLPVCIPRLASRCRATESRSGHGVLPHGHSSARQRDATDPGGTWASDRAVHGAKTCRGGISRAARFRPPYLPPHWTASFPWTTSAG